MKSGTSTALASCACGARWKHAQNRGHCAGCHRTFVGVATFDVHFLHDRADGRPTCIDPARDDNPKHRWWLDERGHWHEGKRMDEETRERMKEARA